MASDILFGELRFCFAFAGQTLFDEIAEYVHMIDEEEPLSSAAFDKVFLTQNPINTLNFREFLATRRCRRCALREKCAIA